MRTSFRYFRTFSPGQLPRSARMKWEEHGKVLNYRNGSRSTRPKPLQLGWFCTATGGEYTASNALPAQQYWLCSSMNVWVYCRRWPMNCWSTALNSLQDALRQGLVQIKRDRVYLLGISVLMDFSWEIPPWRGEVRSLAARSGIAKRFGHEKSSVLLGVEVTLLTAGFCRSDVPSPGVLFPSPFPSLLSISRSKDLNPSFRRQVNSSLPSLRKKRILQGPFGVLPRQIRAKGQTTTQNAYNTVSLTHM